jgi:hypothetical protein
VPPIPVTQFPQPAPTISGQNLTLSIWLKSPALVQRAIEDLSLNRFIADLIFSGGPEASGGAVVYDQITQTYMFLDRDVQDIRAGAEYPILNGSYPTPNVALTRKWGGEVKLTYDEVRRDRRDLLNKEMIRLRNTIVRKVDAVAVAALKAAPVYTMTASGSWRSSSTDIITDLATGLETVNGPDFGYEVDTALINPREVTGMLSSAEIRTALPRERTDVPIATGNLGRLLGIDFVQTNRVNPGEIFLLQRKRVGGISDEVPMHAKPIDDERRDSWYIHGARQVVPYVTDPKAVCWITGA